MFMDLPADDLTAEDIHDQVEVKEHARERPEYPGYIPGPDLVGCACLVAGGQFAPHRRLGPPLVMQLPIGAQGAVEAGLCGQIPHLVGQFRDDLAWRKAGKFL